MGAGGVPEGPTAHTGPGSQLHEPDRVQHTAGKGPLFGFVCEGKFVGLWAAGLSARTILSFFLSFSP